MIKFIEKIEWFDVEDCLPGHDDNFKNVYYECLCQVQLIDPDVDDLSYPEITILHYDKTSGIWKTESGMPYTWGWKVIAWALTPYGPKHIMFKGDVING